ncbi:MAG TPA: hypothetical protein VK468_01720, partial [Pyrinomonadaceae bacterium]|nr:hypothetical protein [Pyrinomonadaceae bacterium]
MTTAVIFGGCDRAPKPTVNELPTSMKEIPAARLNFRYEPDVPKPEDAPAVSQERNAAVQNDFDQNRPQELLDKTLASPDGKRSAAIYHRAGDLPSEFRLDMYTADGKILHKVTADTMAVHFPDTIVWSPNSENVAFVAMLRGTQPAADGQEPAAATGPANMPVPESAESNSVDTNQNSDANISAPISPPAPTPAAPAAVLTFRTEQIYLANAEGDGVKPITQNEGLIYFYYVWSPDSSMLAALAATAREWQYYQAGADGRGEIFTPVGRPRIVEKNGRERRLD